jgi:putative membrane protein
MIRRVLLKIIVGAFALWVADYFLSGFAVSGGLKGYLIAGLALGLLTMVVRPILKFVAAPLIMLTLGLFTLVINALLLWIAAYLTGLVTIAGLVPLLLATLIITAVHIILDRS